MVEGAETANELFAVVGTAVYDEKIQNKKNHGNIPRRKKPIMSMLILGLIVTGCLLAPWAANHDPAAFYLTAMNTPPNGEFYFGTDALGRDLYSIMFYGGRTSLAIGLLGAAVIAVIGTIYGCVSGTLPDRADAVMMRIAEIGGSIPTLLMVLILSAIIPERNIVTLSLIIGITGWFGMARIVRSEVRQIRNCEYVLYARSSGGSFFYVMWYHLLPNFLSAIMFVVVSNVSTCITMESTLSFLGLGLPVDVLSWGSMLSLANRALIMNTWWVIVIPGLFLVVTLLCITNVADYLRREVNRQPSHL